MWLLKYKVEHKKWDKKKFICIKLNNFESAEVLAERTWALKKKGDCTWLILYEKKVDKYSKSISLKNILKNFYKKNISNWFFLQHL